MTKKSYCKFDPAISFERGLGGLKIYIPTEVGYIIHTFIHSYGEASNCDMWRLSVVFACDDDFENEMPITKQGAEWEMAIMIKGRPDFIGGYAHGDEVFRSLSLQLDGEEKEITSLTEMTPFEEIKIIETSCGYDPLDSKTHVLDHRKEYTVNKDGIKLAQRVKWHTDADLGHCYFAMMPPIKCLTDVYYTDVDPTHTPFSLADLGGNFIVANAKYACLYGKESHLHYHMRVENYDYYPRNIFSVSDNGGDSYNKMYFHFCSPDKVACDAVWEPITYWKIEHKA